MTLVNGKMIAEKLLASVDMSQASNKRVCFLSFGENEVSEKFVEVKKRMAVRLGVRVEVRKEKADLTEVALLALADVLAQDYDGVVIQLPLSPDIDTGTLLEALPLHVDIDMLGLEARTRYRQEKTKRVPPVAEAVDLVLKEGEVELRDKKIVILGNGRLVGESVKLLFERSRIAFCTIDKETSHKERDLLLSEADIVISGIGSPHFLKPDMIKRGVVLIDAGTSDEGGEIRGDIDPACTAIASLFTPVPGGVGPITVASLFVNLFRN